MNISLEWLCQGISRFCRSPLHSDQMGLRSRLCQDLWLRRESATVFLWGFFGPKKIENCDPHCNILYFENNFYVLNIYSTTLMLIFLCISMNVSESVIPLLFWRQISRIFHRLTFLANPCFPRSDWCRLLSLRTGSRLPSAVGNSGNGDFNGISWWFHGNFHGNSARRPHVQRICAILYCMTIAFDMGCDLSPAIGLVKVHGRKHCGFRHVSGEASSMGPPCSGRDFMGFRTLKIGLWWRNDYPAW